MGARINTFPWAAKSVTAILLFWFFSGGCSDPSIEEPYELLTAQKHRTEVPEDASVTDVTIDTMVHWSGNRVMPPPGTPRERISPEERAYLFTQEWRPVRLTGYLLEASNQSDGDIHLTIGDSANSDFSRAVIVEMTSHFRQLHQWQLPTVQTYRQGLVRVTGWFLWDEEHGVGPDRATVWEIHPITKFEVFDGTSWRAL